MGAEHEPFLSIANGYRETFGKHDGPLSYPAATPQGPGSSSPGSSIGYNEPQQKLVAGSSRGQTLTCPRFRLSLAISVATTVARGAPLYKAVHPHIIGRITFVRARS